MGCRELFLAQSSWRERRAAHEEVRLELLPSATVHVTPAGGREVASVVRVGLFKFVGFPLRKQVESVTQWSPDIIFLGQVINRFSCFLRVDAASKVVKKPRSPSLVGRS